jgi:single-strand DNA-binding protein
MGNYNKVILMGNITRDIEVRHLPTTNTAVAKIGLAVNRKWRDAAGELKEEVTYVDCEAFGKTAENISKFFAKGKPIFLEGRLKLDTWKDKTDGSNRSKLKVVVDSFEFVESKGGGGAGGGGFAGGAPARSAAPAAAGARSAPAPASQEGYEPIQEEDIPF